MNRFVKLVSVGVSLVAVLVLFGWVFDITAIKMINPEWVVMKPITAFSFLILGFIHLLLLENRSESTIRARRKTILALACLVGFTGLFVFSEYILNRYFQIPKLFNKESFFHTIMAPNTAFCFMLLALNIVLDRSKQARYMLVSQLSALLAGMISLLAIVGYLYGVEQLYKVAPFATMALHTAILFFFLSVSSLVQQSQYGVAKFLTFDSLTRSIGLRLLALTIFLPILLGWLRIEGQNLGFYEFEFGTAIFVVAVSATLGAIVFYSLKIIGGAIEKQKSAELALQTANAALERTVSERTEQIVKEQERFTMAIDAADLSTWEIDLATGIITRTRNHHKIFGLDRDLPPEEVDMAIAKRIHPEDIKLVTRLFNTAKEQLEGFEAEFRIVWSDNSVHWILTRGKPVFVNGKAIKLAGITKDVTQRKLLEHQLIQSAKMASLGEMAGGIAHEINTPLATISMRSGQIQRLIQESDFDTLTEAADVINRTVFRIANIIKALRAFAKDGENEPMQRVSLSSLIDDTLPLCQERFKNHGVSVVVPEILSAQVDCRPTQVSQALLNLLNNAYDAIENLDEKWIRIEVGEKQESFELSVTDSGNGIPKEVEENIMRPFYTTKEVGKGMGLGLSISKGMIESQNGFLALDHESKNTRFVIGLPKTVSL